LLQSKYEKNVLRMAKIVIENLYGKILLVQDAKKTLLQHFHDHHIDWMHACGGKGRCTTCKVIVRSGMDKLDPLTPAEARYRSLNALTNEERLSCQTKVLHDIAVAAPEEYKLPHISYSS
jgi:2Fe-2S ferredoxin